MTLFSKLKQFQDLRNKAKEFKNLMADEIIEVNEAGVKIIINGNQEILEIKITEDLLNLEKKVDLEKILERNFNEAIKKIQRLMAEKIKSAGFQLPNLN